MDVLDALDLLGLNGRHSDFDGLDDAAQIQIRNPDRAVLFPADEL